MKLNVPPQIPRLALAFAIFIILFLIARHFLVPETFGQYGHYRGESLNDNAAMEIRYAGQQACIECHEDIQEQKTADVHSDIHCETCHGPGQKHFITGDTADIMKPHGRAACGICHEKNAAKSRNVIFQVDLNEHNPGKNCTECHNPHKPWEMKK
ncbi:MAG TPA: multiheme c-type cytochrome [Bacteroidales bacterium]|jgi:hypothetical protein|nr:multiheme c-type cytochrome [Bacteroidales bacterium]